MADDLTIEVTGSAEKAASALDRIIQKITDLQARFEKAAPSVSKFAADMDKIASSSRQWSSFDKMASSVDKQAQVSKKAEANMAMYQARLERANVSMERSRVSSERLAAAQQKSLAISQAAANAERLRGIIGSRSSAQSAEQEVGYSAIPPDVRAINQRSQDEAAAFTARAAARAGAGSTPVSLNAGAATAEVRRMGEYIDGLTPKIANMSAEAQAQFNALAAKLNLVSQQIDNQNMLYSSLAAKAARVGAEQGNGSDAYLRLEKRMLSADSAANRLSATQEKLKAQLAGVASGAALAGEQSERAARKSASGWYRTLDMFGRMLIRIAAFKAYSAIAQGITTGLQNMALANSQANATMSALSTNALYLKNSLGAALMPALQALIPVINQVSDALANVFNTIGMLIARVFNHASTVTIAKRANVDYAATLDKTKASADAAKKSLMGFDELNILNAQKANEGVTSPGMPSYDTMFETVKIPGWVNNIGNFTDTIGKIIGDWWNGLTDAQKWGAGIGGTAGFVIGGIIGHLIGGPIGQVVGSVLGGVIGVIIGTWWAGLTTKEKWGAGIGATAGAVIGAIIGGLVGGKIGAAVGAVLGGTVGALIGKWWSDLTTPEKWSAGIGAGAGAVIGGIVGGILTGGNPIGIVVGAALIGTIGLIVGKFWSDLTTPQKWSVGIGAGAGAIIGGIIGGMIGGPIGVVVGATLGGTIGTIIGQWWSGLTTKQKWSAGVGASAGAVIGGIIGGIIAGPIGVVVGAALGGTAGTIIAQWWSTLKTKQKWSVGTTGIGAIVGAFIGTIFLGPLGTILGAGIGGLAGNLIEKFWDYLSNKNNWKIGKGVGIAATIGGIIGAIIGGPLGAAIGAAIAGGAAFAIEKYTNKTASGSGGGIRDAAGTAFHPGGPVLVNDQLGPIYQELIRLPNGLSFIPSGRNVLIPDLPRGSSVLNATETKNLLPHYAEGAGNLSVKSIFDQGGQLNSDSNILTRMDSISERLKSLEKAILDRPVNLYSDDRKIAESSNRGNRLLGKTAPTN